MRPLPESTQSDLRRNIIIAYVSAHPCCTLRAIAEGTGLPLVMAKYHCERLAQLGKLYIDRHKKWWCIFLPGTVMADTPQARAIADPDLWVLWVWMHSQERLLQDRIVKHAKRYWRWSPATTRHRLKRLVEAGLLMHLREGKASKVIPASLNIQQRGLRT